MYLILFNQSFKQIADDTVIQKEGLENLTIQELQNACKERGMRAIGLSAGALRKQLQQWLDLSQNAKVRFGKSDMSLQCQS